MSASEGAETVLDLSGLADLQTTGSELVMCCLTHMNGRDVPKARYVLNPWRLLEDKIIPLKIALKGHDAMVGFCLDQAAWCLRCNGPSHRATHSHPDWPADSLGY